MTSAISTLLSTSGEVALVSKPEREGNGDAGHP
jgi:hypothetical protein